MDYSNNFDNSSSMPYVTTGLYQPWGTMLDASNFERRRVTRLVWESLEMGFHLCNLYLERYGVAKLFDIVNQLIPTAFVVNTGYWAFYSCKAGPSLCVCTRFGIRCPHVRNEHHWVNMDAYYESEQNCTFRSRTGPFCPSDCHVDVFPITNEFVTGYDVRIRMTVPDNDSCEEQSITLVVEARYTMIPERLPEEKKFVQFCPHPLAHPYYARYFDILHSFCETWATQDQFARLFTSALSGFPKFIRSVNDDVGLPIPKRSPHNPNRPEFDTAVLNELSDKFSAVLYYADGPVRPRLSNTNCPIQNVFTMTSTIKLGQPPYNDTNENLVNNYANPRFVPATNRNNHQNQNGAKRRLPACDQPSFGGGSMGYQQSPLPPVDNYKRPNKRGGRRGRGRQTNNQLKDIAPAPPTSFVHPNSNHYNTPHHSYSYVQPAQYLPQYQQVSYAHLPPTQYSYPYQAVPSVAPSQFVGVPWEVGRAPPATAAPHWQNFAASGYQNTAVILENRQLPKRVPVKIVTEKKKRQGVLVKQEKIVTATPEPNLFGPNYKDEFPALPHSQRYNETSSSSSEPLNDVSKESDDKELQQLMHNPSLDTTTNDLLDDIAKVIEEDLAEDTDTFIQFDHEEIVVGESDFADEVELKYHTKNEAKATPVRKVSRRIESGPSYNIKQDTFVQFDNEELVVGESDFEDEVELKYHTKNEAKATPVRKVSRRIESEPSYNIKQDTFVQFDNEELVVGESDFEDEVELKYHTKNEAKATPVRKVSRRIESGPSYNIKQDTFVQFDNEELVVGESDFEDEVELKYHTKNEAKATPVRKVSRRIESGPSYNIKQDTFVQFDNEELVVGESDFEDEVELKYHTKNEAKATPVRKVSRRIESGPSYNIKQDTFVQFDNEELVVGESDFEDEVELKYHTKNEAKATPVRKVSRRIESEPSYNIKQDTFVQFDNEELVVGESDFEDEVELKYHTKNEAKATPVRKVSRRIESGPSYNIKQDTFVQFDNEELVVGESDFEDEVELKYHTKNEAKATPVRKVSRRIESGPSYNIKQDTFVQFDNEELVVGESDFEDEVELKYHTKNEAKATPVRKVSRRIESGPSYNIKQDTFVQFDNEELVVGESDFEDEVELKYHTKNEAKATPVRKISRRIESGSSYNIKREPDFVITESLIIVSDED